MEIRTESTKKTPDELEKVREQYRSEAFKLMLYVLVIFGVPATLAVLLGRWLDGVLVTGKLYTIVLLVVAFVGSWVIMIIRYRAIDKKLKEVDRAIQAEK